MKKKIIISFSVSLLILIIGLTVLYIFSTDNLKFNKEQAISVAKKAVDLESVHNIDWFHYIDSYYVIEGHNQAGEEIIVWVPEDDKNEIKVIEANKGLRKEEVIKLLYDGLDHLAIDKRPIEIRNVKLGMVDEVPAYEVTYYDQKNRYSIIYIDFYKGEWFRVYNL